jgi:hypothetical protein
MGETAQAIEYLEFLQEDPPTTEGIGLTHVLGYLALCFENKGSIYLVALEGECEEWGGCLPIAVFRVSPV